MGSPFFTPTAYKSFNNLINNIMEKLLIKQPNELLSVKDREVELKAIVAENKLIAVVDKDNHEIGRAHV